MSRLVLARKAFWDARVTAIGGGILSFGLALLYVLLFPSIQESFEELDLPEYMESFSGAAGSYSTPEGYLATEFFTAVPITLVIFAIVAGTATAGEESAGTLDMLLAQPIRRRRVIVEKALGIGAAVSVALLAGLPGIYLGQLFVDMDISPWRTLAATMTHAPSALPVRRAGDAARRGAAHKGDGRRGGDRASRAGLRRLHRGRTGRRALRRAEGHAVLLVRCLEGAGRGLRGMAHAGAAGGVHRAGCPGHLGVRTARHHRRRARSRLAKVAAKNPESQHHRTFRDLRLDESVARVTRLPDGRGLGWCHPCAARSDHDLPIFADSLRRPDGRRPRPRPAAMTPTTTAGARRQPR